MEGKTGICKYCQQTRLIEPDELLAVVRDGTDPQDAADAVATGQCDCVQAKNEREKKRSMGAANDYIENILEEDETAVELGKAAIRAVYVGTVDKCSLKIGKRTYTIDTDGGGDIRIKNKYQEEDEATF